MMGTKLKDGDRAMYRLTSLYAPLKRGDAAFDTLANEIVTINGDETLDDFKEGEEVLTEEYGKCTVLYDGAMSSHDGKFDILAEDERQHSVDPISLLDLIWHAPKLNMLRYTDHTQHDVWKAKKYLRPLVGTVSKGYRGAWNSSPTSRMPKPCGMSTNNNLTKIEKDLNVSEDEDDAQMPHPEHTHTPCLANSKWAMVSFMMAKQTAS